MIIVALIIKGIALIAGFIFMVIMVKEELKNDTF